MRVKFTIELELMGEVVSGITDFPFLVFGQHIVLGVGIVRSFLPALDAFLLKDGPYTAILIKQYTLTNNWLIETDQFIEIFINKTSWIVE